MPTTNPNKRRIPPLTIENARIIYRNFSGAAKTYNAAGLRNFHVVLDNDVARTLAADGWNVRWHEPKKEGEDRWASLKVAVRFDNYPPKIVLVSKGVKTPLDPDSVSILDDATLETVDVVISPSQWKNERGEGIKAYLQKMFAVLSPSDI